MGEDDSRNFIKISYGGLYNGTSWDEKGNSKIVQIFVTYGSAEINSIQFQYYADNGTLLLSDRYGATSGTIGTKFDAVRLNYPLEYITWISTQDDSSNYICSITIGTNLGEYGPFGKVPQPPNPVRDCCFRLGKEQQFGGFWGYADTRRVYGIGVYLKPITTLEYCLNRNVIELTEQDEN